MKRVIPKVNKYYKQLLLDLENRVDLYHDSIRDEKSYIKIKQVS